jgi:hypothetical protein
MHACVSSPDRKTKPLYEVTNNFENLAKLNYLGTSVTSQNCILDENK